MLDAGRWFVRWGDEYGPFSPDQLRALAGEERLGPTDDVRREDLDEWVPAGRVTELWDAEHSVSSRSTSPGSSRTLLRAGVVTGIVLGVVVAIELIVAFSTNTFSGSGLVQPSTEFEGTLPHDSVARLNLQWAEATGDLLPLVQRMTPGERAALGLVDVAPGTDVYGARVVMTNTGDVPIRVFPENLLIHFGEEAAAVSTLDDARFLRPVVLQPSAVTSGFVTFVARRDIGAAIHGGSGGMSYEDDTIEVTYE